MHFFLVNIGSLERFQDLLTLSIFKICWKLNPTANVCLKSDFNLQKTPSKKTPKRALVLWPVPPKKVLWLCSGVSPIPIGWVLPHSNSSPLSLINLWRTMGTKWSSSSLFPLSGFAAPDPGGRTMCPLPLPSKLLPRRALSNNKDTTNVWPIWLNKSKGTQPPEDFI